MSSGARSPYRFQFAGSLLESSFYVERPADKTLPELLSRGIYCNVLAPRQIGKSSLRARVSAQLTAAGVRCASVDLTAIGTAATLEEWYFGLVDEIARRLDLPDPVDFWETSASTVVHRRWVDYLRLVLKGDLVGRQLVLFFDEIEAVRLVPFPMDNFFLSIRSLYEERSQDPDLHRLTFCLMGVTAPAGLVMDTQITPYNITHVVRLDDFSRDEMETLRPGLSDLGADAGKLLDQVYAWTDGHPYMTMRTCAALVRREVVVPGAEAHLVARVIEEEFLRRPMEDANLSYAALRFVDTASGGGPTLTEKISLCLRLLEGESIPANHGIGLPMELRLCGLIKDVDTPTGPRLRFRNRIFATVFDQQWFKAKGDRRFIAESVWKWIKEERTADYVLRGDALDSALEWARTAVLSDDERLFLEASQRERNQELEERRRVIHREVTQARRLLAVMAASLVVLLFVVGRLVWEVRNLQVDRTSLAAETVAAQRALDSVNQLRQVEGTQLRGRLEELERIRRTSDEAIASLNATRSDLEQNRQNLDEVIRKKESASATLISCRREGVGVNKDLADCRDSDARARSALGDCRVQKETCDRSLATANAEIAAKETSYGSCRKLRNALDQALDVCQESLEVARKRSSK